MCPRAATRPRLRIVTSSRDRLDLGELVRRQQDRRPCVLELEHEVAHVALAHGVEARRRLVEHEHLRRAEQRLRESEPLQHAARELREHRLLPAVEPHAVEQLVGLLGELGARHAARRP